MADNSLFPSLASMLPGGSTGSTVPQFQQQNLANPAALMQAPQSPLQIGPVTMPGAQQSGMQGLEQAQQLQQMQTLQQQQQTQAAQQVLALKRAQSDSSLADKRSNYVSAMLDQSMNLTDLAGGAMKDKLLSDMSSDELKQHENEAAKAALNQQTSAQYEDALQGMEGKDSPHVGLPPGMGDKLRASYKQTTGTSLDDLDDNQTRQVFQFGKLQAQATANSPNNAQQVANKLREQQEVNKGTAAQASISAGGNIAAATIAANVPSSDKVAAAQEAQYADPQRGPTTMTPEAIAAVAARHAEKENVLISGMIGTKLKQLNDMNLPDADRVKNLNSWMRDNRDMLNPQSQQDIANWNNAMMRQKNQQQPASANPASAVPSYAPANYKDIPKGQQYKDNQGNIRVKMQ